MTRWEAELDALLAALDVARETPLAEAPLPAGGEGSTCAPAGAPTSMAPLAASSVDDTPGDEVQAIRREIEATLAQVAWLARAGRIERAIREDVVFVLRALMRPRPRSATAGDDALPAEAPAAESVQEWDLTSAAAVLRFCRIVQRLGAALTPTGD